MQITIDGVQYDLSNFRHPGGALVLRNLSGKDATEEFRLFHPPGTLIRFKGKPAEKRKDDKMLDFLALEKHMRDIGLFKSTPVFYVERALSLISLFWYGCKQKLSNFFCILFGYVLQQLSFVGRCRTAV